MEPEAQTFWPRPSSNCSSKFNAPQTPFWCKFMFLGSIDFQSDFILQPWQIFEFTIHRENFLRLESHFSQSRRLDDFVFEIFKMTKLNSWWLKPYGQIGFARLLRHSLTLSQCCCSTSSLDFLITETKRNQAKLFKSDSQGVLITWLPVPVLFRNSMAALQGR